MTTRTNSVRSLGSSKSAARIAAQRELAELEATIAAENARREAEKRDKATAPYDRQLGQTLPMASVNLTSSGILPRSESVNRPRSASGVNLAPIPVTGAKELPEAALLLLRELWMNLGYEGTQFVEMQMEIERELQNGDFARFEREMLCNEVLAQRTEINKLRTERTELLRRNAATKDDLADVLAAEEKTYRALLSEREAAQRHLAEAEEAAHSASLDAEKEAMKVGVLSEEMERLERERVAAILYAKKVEISLMAFKTAAPAPKGVPVSAPPRVGMARRGTASGPNPTQLHHPPTDTANVGWTERDEAELNKKLQERKLAAEDARLAAEEKRLAADRAKARLDQDRLQSQHDGLRAAVDSIRSAAAGHWADTASKVLPSTTPRSRDMGWGSDLHPTATIPSGATAATAATATVNGAGAVRRSAWDESRLPPVGSGMPATTHGLPKSGGVSMGYGSRGLGMNPRTAPPPAKKVGGW